MAKKYDAVVCGAGNSGLAAALQLSLAGKKTLLIEQHNLPGGSASSFRRGRFEIEPSLHELCDVGSEKEPGEVRELFKEFGLKIRWNECPDCFRLVSKWTDTGEPMDVTMPAGIDNFINKMEEYVPGSKPKMKELFELFQEVLDTIYYISSSNGNPDSNYMKEHFPNTLRTGAYSTKKVFDAMGIPERCQNILQTYWCYLGVNLERLGFVHYCAMVHKYVSRGAYIPTYTSHELSQAFIKRIRELGGDVWYNCRAEKFLFNGDKLCGVKTTLGDVECDFALPNINPDIVYGKMVPKELVPERQVKLANARAGKYGGRMITAYFCMDVPAEELGISDYSIFMQGTADSVEAYKGLLEGGDANQFAIFLCYNIANPKASPDGTCICSFTTFASPNDWNDLSQEDYFKQKQWWAEKFLKMLKEKANIDLHGHIEEMSVASAWTFARYLNTPEGSVYGHEASNWDGMMNRLQTLGADYPIKGLRPIGAAGPRSLGYSATYLTGQMMARLALKDMKEWEGGDE
ncbi:MAG: FAD-dependent oxidoreductase [Coriobacteriia bacterium]|nr:FAD-dependent oxidoreductase [Coriobacteriia bacterium]